MKQTNSTPPASSLRAYLSLNLNSHQTLEPKDVSWTALCSSEGALVCQQQPCFPLTPSPSLFFSSKEALPSKTGRLLAANSSDSTSSLAAVLWISCSRWTEYNHTWKSWRSTPSPVPSSTAWTSPVYPHTLLTATETPSVIYRGVEIPHIPTNSVKKYCIAQTCLSLPALGTELGLNLSRSEELTPLSSLLLSGLLICAGFYPSAIPPRCSQAPPPSGAPKATDKE